MRVWNNSDGTDAYVPDDLSDVTMIGIGSGFAAVLSKNGSLNIWDPDEIFSEQTILTDVRSFCVGSTHLVAVNRDGTVSAWGSDDSGETDVPQDVKGAAAVAAGDAFSLALMRSGRIAGWGNNDKGQLMPPHFNDVIAIAAGDKHGLGLRRNGTVFAWGDNSVGQTTIPAGLAKIVAIAAGGNHSVALTSDGRVITWGDADNVNPNTGLKTTPVPTGLRHVARIAAGGSHILALIYAPVILNQPQSQSDDDPQYSVINIQVSGRSPMSYSWRLNGKVIKTTTTPFLRVRTPANSQIAARQKYDLIVRNRYGAVVSQQVTVPPLDGGDYGFISGSVPILPGVGVISVIQTMPVLPSGPLPPPPLFQSAAVSSSGITISKQNDSIVLSWTIPGAVLECANSIDAQFSTNVGGVQNTLGATNVVTIPIVSQQKFYRLRATSN